MIKKIPAGTQFYITKKQPYTFYIQPDKSLLNDNLYVLYDVRVDGQTIIPKNTRVVGNWITESTPIIAAQLQITRIFLQADGQDIMADSETYDTITTFNNREIQCVDYFYQPTEYHSASKITRRIVNFNHSTKTLLDNNRNSIYLEIPTNEIMVTVTLDFIAMPCISMTGNNQLLDQYQVPNKAYNQINNKPHNQITDKSHNQQCNQMCDDN